MDEENGSIATSEDLLELTFNLTQDTRRSLTDRERDLALAYVSGRDPVLFLEAIKHVRAWLQARPEPSGPIPPQ